MVPRCKQCDDPVFGYLTKSWGTRLWEGMVPFDHEPTRTMTLAVLIDAGDGDPTEAQRALFQEIAKGFESHWPRIGEALARQHTKLKTLADIEEHMAGMCVTLERPLGEWSIEFDFELDGERPYLASFHDWALWKVEV